MESTPTDPGESGGCEDADQVATRLLAEVAAAKARLAEAALTIRAIDRSLAAGPQRPAADRPGCPGPPAGTESE